MEAKVGAFVHSLTQITKFGLVLDASAVFYEEPDCCNYFVPIATRVKALESNAENPMI
jgi:hypothetical protein